MSAPWGCCGSYPKPYDVMKLTQVRPFGVDSQGVSAYLGPMLMAVVKALVHTNIYMYIYLFLFIEIR